MKSLEKQLLIGQGLSLLVFFLLLFWMSLSAVRSIGEHYVQTRLEHDAEALLSALWVNPRGQLVLREGRVTPIYQQPFSGHYFQFDFSAGRQIASRSLWENRLPAGDLATGDVLFARKDGPSSQQLLVRSAGYSKLDLEFTLTVGEDIDELEKNIHHYEKLVMLVFGLLMFAGLLMQRLLLRRGFAALDQVREELQQISSGRQQQLSELGPTEITPVTGEVNRLLGQMHNRLRRSREALGNLAHALKGPLSRLMQEVDHLDIEHSKRETMSAQLDVIGKLVDRELRKARIAGDSSGRRFNPSLVLPELVQALHSLYPEKKLTVQQQNSINGELPFEHEDMMELLGNLLDNAFKWADSRILISLQIKENNQLYIVLEDDGNGVSDTDLQILQQRGSRLDEQRPGHGLGLAIVRDLVEDYHGHIELTGQSDSGGLQVEVTLPLLENR